jgi:hypothetical protein
MEENKDLDAEFRVRLPTALAKKIEAVAEKERRSKNSQYVYILENWFVLKDSLEEKATVIKAAFADTADDVSREKTVQKKKAAG